MAFQMNNLDWLARNSPFIFVGRVSSTNAQKDARGLIITKNRFAVERVIAGDGKTKTVTLTTLGGTVGDESTTVSNMPEFTANQHYLVFTDLKRTVYNPITGNLSGVFLIVDGAVYTYDGRAVAGVERGRIQGSDVTLELPGTGKAREKSAPESTNPRTSGTIVSIERAAGRVQKPMRLEAFIKAVQTAARR
jgi:hypothetical protein